MVYDLHNDLLTSGLPQDETLFKARNFPVRGILFAVWTTELLSAENAVLRAGQFVERLPYPAAVGIEDCGFLKNKSLEMFANVPIRYASLTWNADNGLAGGAMSDGRLSGEGRRLLQEMIASNIAVDLAHLNERSFYDVVDFCAGRARLLCTHTALAGRMKHPRNLTDLQIKTLIAAGGIVGLAAVRSFLSREMPDALTYAEHIVDYAETFGVGSLAIGTDMYGTAPLEGLEHYGKFTDMRERLGKYLTQKQIDKIFYKNAETYFLQEPT